MKKLLLLPLLLGCISIPRPDLPEPPKPVLESALSDTVALVNAAGDVYCSGVIVEAVILTAEHCVDSPGPFWVGFRGCEEEVVGIIKVGLLYADPKRDLAILRPVTKQLHRGRILAPEAPVDGSRAVVVGHPLGLAWTITEGIVSRERRVEEDGRVWMQVSAPVFFGNSGGPTFNTYGEVTGIVSFLVGTPHLAGVVHHSQLVEALDRIRN